MNNTTVFDDPDPISAMWLGLLYAVYASIGIPANILVLVLSLTKNVRIHPINICIFSIAFSDMMLLVSTLSSTLWAFTRNMTICKVGGVGIYMFIMLSMTLPSCLSLCRHAGLAQEHELHPVLRPLRRRKGILILNGMYWTYGLLYPLPYILTDRMGLDAMGFCGVVEINSVLLWAYYVVFICGVLFSAYLTTFIFYRKLSSWVETTTSMMTATPQTNETLALTRSIMRMIRWILFVPVVFYHPALLLETAMRLSPNLVSVSIARIFMSTCPLPHVIDPFVTLLFVRCYRTTLTGLISRGRMIFKHSVYPSNGILIVQPQSNAPISNAPTSNAPKSLSSLIH